jgi:hypothetical protein
MHFRQKIRGRKFAGQSVAKFELPIFTIDGTVTENFRPTFWWAKWPVLGVTVRLLLKINVTGQNVLEINCQ